MSVLFIKNFELFVNNNFKKTGIAKFLNKIIFKNNTPVFFEKLFKDYLDFKDYRIYKHPIHKIELKKSDLPFKYIYCHFTEKPSDSELEYLFKLKEEKQCKLLTSSLFCKNNKQFVYENYFNNYFQTLTDAEILYLSVHYEYRISGVFYDFLSFQKEIIINCRSNFYFKLMENYSDRSNLYYFKI